MKGFAWYWILGCLFAAPVLATAHKSCPDDEIKPAEVAAFVAVWPAFIVASFFVTTDGKVRCEKKG